MNSSVLLNKKPLVSVLLPSYNHEGYIREAIDSIIQQTYSNIELIVIDDGSSDKSKDIIYELSRVHGFKFISRANQGLIHTLEQLLRLVSPNSDYISLFSSDDLYHERKIEVLVDTLEKNKNASVAYSKISIIDSNSKVKREICEDYHSGDIFDDLLYGRYSINGIGTLVRTGVYKEIEREEMYVDDFQLWLKIAERYKFIYVNECLSFYRLHNNHKSSNVFEMQKGELLTILKYKERQDFQDVISAWNIRWFGLFARKHKAYAIRYYLPKILVLKNFTKLRFYRSLVKLFLK